jgi:hypothetical protein
VGPFFNTILTGVKELFNTTTHRFGSDIGDKGAWSGGGRTIKMVWKHGSDAGLTSSGTFDVGSSPKEYEGKFGDTEAGDSDSLTEQDPTFCRAPG